MPNYHVVHSRKLFKKATDVLKWHGSKIKTRIIENVQISKNPLIVFFEDSLETLAKLKKLIQKQHYQLCFIC
jgi:hypothetical protein